jgi:hypothetical protein
MKVNREAQGTGGHANFPCAADAFSVTKAPIILSVSSITAAVVLTFRIAMRATVLS